MSMASSTAQNNSTSPGLVRPWPEWVDRLPPMPEGAKLVPWSFIADGDMTERATHRYGVWVSSSWSCAGCLASPHTRYTTDNHPGWPRLTAAPNGMRLVMAYDPEGMFRRPLCPLKGEQSGDREGGSDG